MSPSKQITKLISSRRWVSFLESVGTGLQLNMVLITEGEIVFNIFAKCPSCNQDYEKVSYMDIETILEPYKSPASFEQSLGNYEHAVIISLGGNYFIRITECTCLREKGLLNLQQRAAIAEKLIRSFQTSFMDGIAGGQSAVELSALRQMNRIILSLFRENNNASTIAFDLILSALIIMLDAEASWLEYNDGIQSGLIIKGDQKKVEAYLQSGNCDNIQVSTSEINCKHINGRLGVIMPDETEQAGTLLPLLTQECIIVFEIESLFRLLREQLSRILGAFNNALILIDQHFRIVYLNNAAEKLFDDILINLYGRSAVEVNAPWAGHLKEKTAQPVSGYKNIFSRGEENLLLDWQLLPLKEKETVVGWLVNADDRTEYYHWQEIGRQAESFTSIASVIGPLAHELRNPLAAAKGLLQLAGRKKEPEKISGYMELVLREIDRMSMLVNEFLQLGKTTNMNFESVDLITFVNELMPLLEGETIGAEIELIRDFEFTPPILCDSSQMTQVLLNLTRNAIESIGREGRLTIIIRHEEEWVVLGIKDTGPGIKPEVMDKIFQPFFTTKERGTGLGLAVIKAIVHNHGGHITVTNHPDGGALFSVRLPVFSQKSEEPRKVDIMIDLADEWIRYPVEQVLQASGLSTLIVNKAAQVVMSGEKIVPGVILLDSDVTTDIGLIRKAWPKAKMIIIGQPANPIGGNDLLYIPKPVNYARLVEDVRAIVEA